MHKLSARVIDGEADNPVNTIVSGHLPEAPLYPLFSGGLSRTRQSLAEIALSRRTLPLTTTGAPPLRRFVGTCTQGAPAVLFRPWIAIQAGGLGQGITSNGNKPHC